jgi:FtsP/CotA-like multicopper oxidase with cupredoxin domain
MQGMPGMGSAKSPLGSDIEDITYPAYLINGRTASDPATYDVRPGERVRVRLINAASSTPFRVAAGGGRRLTVIASDGYAVKPVTVDTLLIGMGERYDVLVTAPKSGSLPIVAQAEGLTRQALAVLRAGPGPAPRANVKPKTLTGNILRYSQLRRQPQTPCPSGSPTAPTPCS